jgi:hypothetical protein
MNISRLLARIAGAEPLADRSQAVVPVVRLANGSSVKP